ncbi:MAG TPA: OsmC family protein [Acidiferrobacterales bacterium]|nr:OsmC family protein [Acidiferrobacterales bacterium]
MQLTITHEEELRFSAHNDDHRLVIDLPEPLGGTGQGMTPPQLFVASLGACLGVYVVDYCETVGVPSQGLKIQMHWEQSDRPKRIGRIRAEIELPEGDVTPARLAAIRRVAEQCLLHNTLKEAPAFDIEISTAGTQPVPELVVASATDRVIAAQSAGQEPAPPLPRHGQVS